MLRQVKTVIDGPPSCPILESGCSDGGEVLGSVQSSPDVKTGWSTFRPKGVGGGAQVIKRSYRVS